MSDLLSGERTMRAALNPPARRRNNPTAEISRDREAAAPAAEPEPILAEADQVEPAQKRTGDNWRVDGSYVVGKGQTPVHTRWQKGQSGNPRGKKKGTPNNDTIIMDLMDTSITVKTAAGDRKMTRKAALFQRMWEMAAKGDLKAARFLLDRYAEAQVRRAGSEVEITALSDEDLAMVESFIGAMGVGAREDSQRKQS